MLMYKSTQERVDKLLSGVQEYKLWIREYENHLEYLKGIAKEYIDSLHASPETCEAEELMIILAAIDEMEYTKLSHDDHNTRCSDLKDWCIDPVNCIKRNVKDLLDKQINKEYFHGGNEEDEYI